MSKGQHDFMFKIILIGSSGVGKSNILLRFTRDQFNEHHQMTVGVQYAAKNVEVGGKTIRLQVWDTLGQQQYKAIMKTFYKGASAVLLTYDISSQKSFEDLDYWYKQIKEYSKSEVVVMLVGNKSDLEQQRKITKQRGLQYAEKKKIAFYEVSAKDGTNIELIFTKIAEGRHFDHIELSKIMEEYEKNKEEEVLESVQISVPSTVVIKKENDLKNKKRQRKCCS